MTEIALSVNGRTITAAIEPRMHLADFLREHVGLTGTHLGCEHGICGACTLLVDDVPVRSCITYAVACDGAAVTTIEGLDDDEIARELRAAFSREHALQCGYCTPGMLVSARDTVIRLPRADEQDVRVAMSGNLCRCTGYVGIVRATLSVIEERRARGIAAAPDAGRRSLGPAGSRPGKAGGPSQPRRIETTAWPPARRLEAAPIAIMPAGDFEPQVTLTQSFVVHHPREHVWAFFARVDEVASCLPGASVTGGDDHNVTGRMRLKVGPIAAEFEGAASIARDPATCSGVIRGSGRDRRSSSATQGMIRYRLAAEGADATRVEVAVGYALTGPLAQFGRSGLVQDIANRLTRTFAQNLEARLAGRESSAPVGTELNAASLVLSVMTERIKAWWRRLLGRRDD
jgi:carbon-monoxide dehydrogenase small subunit